VTSVRQIARSLLLQAARVEAQTLRLPGTDRVLRWLYHPDHRQDDYLAFVGPSDDSLVQIDTRIFLEWSVYLYGTYRPVAADLLRRLLQPGDVAFDLGANVGLFTLPMARRVGPAGAVHAFEPHPGVRRRLIGNLALNNLRNVVVSHLALGADRRQLTLYASSSPGQGVATAHPLDVRNGAAYARTDEPVVCEMNTLDSYVQESGVHQVDLLKISVCSDDLSVLKGARETLQTYKPPVYLSLWADFLATYGTTPSEVLRVLHDLGYEIWLDRNGSRRRSVPSRGAARDRGRESRLERVLESRGIRLSPLSNLERADEWLESYWLAVHPGRVRLANASPADGSAAVSALERSRV